MHEITPAFGARGEAIEMAPPYRALKAKPKRLEPPGPRRAPRRGRWDLGWPLDRQ
uniref:Uncharacterized protein n=1 Tax=Candidatus Kentrum eta TaxID=2126337 RepID=A0A450V119_9GAMM|nr:MAG: hypothetical protein BECKH772A_GA0070896_1002410 [Candidatus Kentron sp. H]VFJ91857.1 MAG: hypothetical protein BECKH772B_GA0070898_100228 [Candidatus Kentron sp. H]VFJ98524.1 MAG: hypothetical protein BECKH772C_GA0070978_100229 [Candidatus Kentron sp. H]